ncbi:MAG TPA: hypothetical protein VMU85_05625 [Stellaceae bacterium]|nr:hypothetical protein [Stellaceae bacterium]
MADTASLSLTRGRIGLSWPLLIAVFVFAATLFSEPRALFDPDVLWQNVTGHWILAHGAVPHVDLFTYTVRGEPWVVHEWLADLLMASAYDALGWHGVTLLAALAAATALGLLTRALSRTLPPLPAMLLAMLAWLMLLPHLLARPHLLAMPLLVAWIAAVLRARDEDRAPPFAWALLMALWANIHGSFCFGLGFAGLIAVEAVLSAPTATERRRALRRWAAFLAVAALAPLVSPNGIESYLLPLRLLRMSYALSSLVEWQSSSFSSFQPLELWLLVALGAGFAFRLRLPASRLAILLLLVHLSLAHRRYGELLGFTAPLLLAPAIGAELRRRLPSAPPGWIAELARPASWRALALAGLLMAAGASLAATRPLSPPRDYMPEAAVRAALAHNPKGPVLNDYNFGGYLIFAGVPTFVDGRTDLFPDAFLERENKALNLVDDGLPSLLDDYRIGWTLMPAGSSAVALLDHLPGWRRLYADDIAVVHVRDETAP